MTTVKALGCDRLCTSCDPDRFDFRSTAELEDLGEVVGQQRALAALKFGVGMANAGYNLFALGPSGTGKHTAVSQFLEARAATERVPMDLIYVNNFADSAKPRAIPMPPGKGNALRENMHQLIKELATTIPAAFESKDYKERIQQIDERFESRQEEAFRHLHDEAERQDVKVFKIPGEFTFAPVVDGKVLDADAFRELPGSEQERINTIVAALQQELQDILQNRIPQWRKERGEQIEKVNDEFTLSAVGHLIDNLRKKYSILPQVVSYLEDVQKDVITNVDVFLESQGELPNLPGKAADSPLRRYQVNLLVDHTGDEGAPVIYEDNPTFPALVGRVEHVSQMGTLVTDFTLIRPGALHRANGGYLVLEARKLLTQPYAWEGLKRALYAAEIRVESLAQVLSMISTVSLEPESVPLDIKIVLLGDRLLYYLLCEYDPDFRELFKVAADFEDRMDRSPENDFLYARLIATLVRKDALLDFSREAVAAVIDESMRLSGDNEKLSARIRSIADLVREASYWAGEQGRKIVGHEDVQRAIDYQTERTDRVRDRIQESILRGIVMIDSEGSRVGQINGLSVMELGETAFGMPVRITATTRLGEGELVDIEREVELGGPIHSKGVFILTNYLGSRYSRNSPLSLSASLTFEQSYGEIEGDSASLAELCALLSSIADLPVDQGLAITGSVNQHGRVQAIGGVNEKIEGFYELCEARGLTGNQGVLIPESNVRHLMLRSPVLDAARGDRFHVYAVETVDQAMELLTGMPAGQADADGTFPPDSVNGRVQDNLRRLADLRHRFNAGPKESDPL